MPRRGSSGRSLDRLEREEGVVGCRARETPGDEVAVRVGSQRVELIDAVRHFRDRSREELFTMADIDGGLIGGASLVADDFITICQAVRK